MIYVSSNIAIQWTLPSSIPRAWQEKSFRPKYGGQKILEKIITYTSIFSLLLLFLHRLNRMKFLVDMLDFNNYCELCSNQSSTKFRHTHVRRYFFCQELLILARCLSNAWQPFATLPNKSFINDDELLKCFRGTTIISVFVN